MKKNKRDQNGLGKARNSRPTIGYLAFGIEDHIADGIWTGIVDAAQQQDVNLVCFVGQRLRDPNGFLAQANVIYDLVNPKWIDGLVIWTSTISSYLDPQESRGFIERYHPLPTVSLGAIGDGASQELIGSRCVVPDVARGEAGQWRGVPRGQVKPAGAQGCHRCR